MERSDAGIEDLYRAVSSRDGWNVYKNLNAQEKADLWTLHLRRALKELPDLTERQRAVIYQALGLLTSGIMEGLSDADVDRPRRASLDELERRAKEVFDPQTGKALFAQLGSGILLDGEVWSFIDPCKCSTDSDWCDWITNPNPYCQEVLCEEQQSGCGTLWLYPCDGICGP